MARNNIERTRKPMVRIGHIKERPTTIKPTLKGGPPETKKGESGNGKS